MRGIRKKDQPAAAARKPDPRGRLPVRKVGLPPGSLIHIGERRTEQVKISVTQYDQDGWEEKELTAVDQLPPSLPSPTVTWIDVAGLHDEELIRSIGNRFHVADLLLEDILDTTQQPKIDLETEYLFLILKILRYDAKSRKIHFEHLSLILGDGFLLSFREGSESPFEHVKERIRGGTGRVRKFGPDYLAYCLIDAIVDQYYVILEKLGEETDVLEEQVATNPSRQTLEGIRTLKKEMIFLRRSLFPQREVINSLARGEVPQIQDSTLPYLRDLYDHTVHCIDIMEMHRDVISGMLDIYLSSISNRLNEIIKVLTIIATIFIPLTFLVGWYGMNFKDMPELTWRWGYPSVILLALAVTTAMLVFFRRKHWI